MLRVMVLCMPLRLLLVLCPLLAFASAEDLSTIAEIRRLPPDRIAESPTFDVTASVTFVARWKNRAEVSVQDETAGIYTYFKLEDADGLKLGDVVHIRGHVTTGMGPPCLSVDSFEVVGVGILPDSRPADFTALDSAELDSQFVEAEGIVRDVQYDPAVAPPSTIISLQMRGGTAELFVAMKPTEFLEGMVDAEVRVRGVPFHYFNQSRQPFGFRLMACQEGQIEVMKAPPQPAFTMPVTKVEQLLRYQPTSQSGHRVRVKGVVTLHWPGEFLYLQDGPVGILVKSRRRDVLKPGDRVDVVAFPVINGYSAILEDAEFRKLEGRDEPPVVDLPLQKMPENGDAKLVRTEGVLESVSERNGRDLLMIRKGPLIVTAELSQMMGSPIGLIPGSKVRLTGVCQIELGSRRKFAAVYRPESARILLRSPADIEVIRPPSWWTPQRLWYALGAAWVVLALGAVWLWSLQTRNARLKREIDRRERAEAELKRKEEERKILAADLHDSLEQSLTGVALQLQAAGKVKSNEVHLELASRLLKHSREEVHRAVRDLREPSDDDFDLGAAIQGLVKRASVGTAVDFQLELPEVQMPLAANLSHQLFHLAQEAVTNALKHADAATIRISLTGGADSMVLEIEDDGVGFSESARPGPAEGHFGLQGMKERVARSGGSFTIDSTAGEGTRIRIALPLKP